MEVEKHYLTIAQNGTILESSRYVATGFPTEVLLMTSIYDSLFDEDLPGFLCVKTQFWDRGQAGAEVYIRRRSVHGLWLWLLSKAVGFVNEGDIFAIILEETVVEDIEVAQRVNKICKISSVLIQAVEASWLVACNPDNSENSCASTRGKKDLSPEKHDETQSSENNTQQLTFDPDEVIDVLRLGVRLDLGLTTLSNEDIKLITLVLSGRVSVDRIIPQLKNALLLAFGLKGIIEKFTLDFERSRRRFDSTVTSLFRQPCVTLPPPISVLNFSYTYIGDTGMEILSEVLYREQSCLKTVDLSFCNVSELGFLSLSKALDRRKELHIPPLKGLILSGNHLEGKSAWALGNALSPMLSSIQRPSKKRKVVPNYSNQIVDIDSPPNGLLVLHLANCSLTAEAACQVIRGLATRSTVRELDLSSNNFGKKGAEIISEVFESQLKHNDKMGNTPKLLPDLERLDLSNNDFGDIGTSRISKAILKRKSTNFMDLKLSFNSIGSVGIETVMNNLIHHHLKSLSLDKNSIGDSGCQLVAASIVSMKSLCRLNLGFNHISSRGITSLMRSLVTCDSITYLAISGNVLKISGSIALAFLLAQHPRLEELEVDNCCLDEASQCHIVAGIISNRLVTMKRLTGFALGPPMAVIRALEPNLAQLSNEECLKIRLNEQMRTFLQWTETNRMAKQKGEGVDVGLSEEVVTDFKNARFLSPDFVSSINEVHNAPSQNPYFRLLGWLTRIPFYDEELTALQKFFYDPDGGEGDRGSDGQINLKVRGDILAALDTETSTEISDELSNLPVEEQSVGIDIDTMFAHPSLSSFSPELGSQNDDKVTKTPTNANVKKHRSRSAKASQLNDNPSLHGNGKLNGLSRSKAGMANSGNLKEIRLAAEKESKSNKINPRITLFPLFEQQLAELKNLTTELIEKEEDPAQHEIILTQYAEAVLVILRQLRYLCMNCGLDGWRRDNVKRKILIVDDALSTRKLLTRAFENANCIVDTAGNGAEGIKKLKESLYDIVFMDIEMPIMDGLEATKQLRKWEDENRPGARQPICALTSKDANQKQLLEIREAGVDVMEKKPCHIPRLLKVIDDVSPMFSDLSTNVSRMQTER